jgi:hypothetical protein
VSDEEIFPEMTVISDPDLQVAGDPWVVLPRAILHDYKIFIIL